MKTYLRAGGHMARHSMLKNILEELKLVLMSEERHYKTKEVHSKVPTSLHSFLEGRH